MSDRTRTLIVQAAGVLIILLAIGAALLPLARQLPDRNMIGSLLLAAGIVELAAALIRTHRLGAAIAAAATILAGLRLLLDPKAGFFEVFNLVILWLVVRTAALGFAGWREQEPLRSWLILAGAVDFLLAIALLAGLPIAVLVVGLFGPAGPIVDTFSWIIAISFVATAVLQIATAKEAGSQPA